MRSFIFIVVSIFMVGCAQSKPKPQLPPGMYDPGSVNIPSNIKDSKIDSSVQKKPIDEGKIKKIEL